MAAEKASAVILADAAAQDRAGTPAAPPSLTDLRHVLDLLPRPRKPSRSTAVQETR